MENADLWQEIKEALDDRTGDTWWIKAPSHTDTEGNEQVDVLAKEGDKSPEVEEQEEGKKGMMETKKRDKEEQDSKMSPKGRKQGRYDQAPEEAPPKTKREKRSGIQGLLHFGHLL